MAQLPHFCPSMFGSGPRYYCHQCEQPFRSQSSSPDSPACPHCKSEFVEAMESDPPVPPVGVMSTPSQPAGGDTDDPEQEQVTFGTPRGFNPMFQSVPPRPGQPLLFPQGTPILSMGVPGSAPVSMPLHEHLRNAMAGNRAGGSQATTQAQTSQTSSQTSQTTPQRDSRSTVNPPPAQRPRQEHTVPAGGEPTDGLADLHFSVGMPWYFMLNHRQHARREQQAQQAQQAAQQAAAQQAANVRASMLGTPLFLGFGGPGAEFLHSSPGDYVWGPQGIDNMISQMLASLEDPGPPPAEQSKIDSLPMVLSTPENMKNCSLCSVCKEDFAESESLLKLPCEHLYHDNCILPWLKLHDTCPTCRYHLNTGKADKEGPVLD